MGQCSLSLKGPFGVSNVIIVVGADLPLILISSPFVKYNFLVCMSLSSKNVEFVEHIMRLVCQIYCSPTHFHTFPLYLMTAIHHF